MTEGTRRPGRALPYWLGAGVLGAIAYRPLVWEVVAPERNDLGGWLFEAEQHTAALLLGLAGWLLWRRRDRLAAASPTGAADRALAGVLGAAGAGVFAWAQLTRADPLLPPSLGLAIAGWAAAVAGRGGVGAVALPSGLLLLPLLLPDPVLDPLVFRLQQWTAGLSGGVLSLLGVAIEREGLLLSGGGRTFMVIESCSGLRGLQLLCGVALLVRELLALRGWRAALVLAVAPGLAVGLNGLRVAAIAALAIRRSQETAAALEDHAWQGIVVLLVGTALLYALGLAISRGVPEPRPPAGGAPSSAAAGAAAIGLAVLAGLSFAVPTFDLPPPAPLPEVPLERADWEGEPQYALGPFVGRMPASHTVLRRYESPGRAGVPEHVELFAVRERRGDRRVARMFGPKIEMPNANWVTVRREAKQLWNLGVEGQAVEARRGDELTLSYVWRPRGRSWWREALRDAWVIEASPWRREPPRAVVRLRTAILFDGPVARDRARQALDRFLLDFRAPLSEL